jgi:hypothetical protein
LLLLSRVGFTRQECTWILRFIEGVYLNPLKYYTQQT